MLYQEMEMENGQPVIKKSKVIDQSKLTSDCWLIQFVGLAACKDCEYANTDECGGQSIRAALLETQNGC